MRGKGSAANRAYKAFKAFLQRLVTLQPLTLSRNYYNVQAFQSIQVLPEQGARSPFKTIAAYRLGQYPFPGNNSKPATFQTAIGEIKDKVASDEFPSRKCGIEFATP